MKILISNDGPSAFYYVRKGLAKAFSVCGHEVVIWNINQKSVYDAFDEFEPDLFLGQTYNATSAVCSAIRERPHMKVIMKAADWGPLTDTIPHSFPIVRVSETEKKNILDLYNEVEKPDYLHIYYHHNYIEGTHGGWIKAGVPVYSHMLAADVFDYTNGKAMDEFRCDIAFIGGYWQYKAQNIDKYFLPLCKDFKHKIKIFGNSPWSVPQYCGFAPEGLEKHILASATICPQLHEPHSTEYGFDMSERTFKLLANRCFIVSDYVEGLEKLFGNDLVMAKNPKEFRDKVEYYLQNPKEREQYITEGYNKVISNHTYFHRVYEIFTNLKLYQYAEHCKTIFDNVSKGLSL
jgi:hypothetical protein